MGRSGTGAETLDRLYNLNVGIIGTGRGRHERPHKPVMLLAVLDLVASGRVRQDRIEWTGELRERFGIYFGIVATAQDKCTPENPFYYLRSDGFWKPYQVDESGRIRELEGPPAARDADTGRVFAQFDEGFAVLSDPIAREVIRRCLIDRYFPGHSAELVRQFLDGPVVWQAVAEDPPEMETARSSAFRRKIMDIYDFQCSACGLRIRIPPDDLTFVDAAHLIPFAESRNDHPSNGIALCRNHHWAMDRSLIAPGPEMFWLVSPLLEERRSPGEAELIRLGRQPVLPPREPGYFPNREGLAWRVQQLRAN